LAGWDHYTAGQTTIGIFLPIADPNKPIIQRQPIDYIVIDWKGWDAVVKPLEAAGILKLG
jgi:hypothetical protein